MGFLDNMRTNMRTTNTRTQGQAAEDTALAYLQAAGLQLVERNYRTPGRGGGEIDLIVREQDGTLVFVEVRSRSRSTYGSAADSISIHKRRRIIFAARYYLQRWAMPPPCRFDAVLIEGPHPPDAPPALQWLRGAFDADGSL